MPTPVLGGTGQLFFEPFADLFSTPLEEPTPPAVEELERSLAHVRIVAADDLTVGNAP